VAQNRLGSVAGSYPNGTYYYPYGEDTGTPLLGDNFATYYRDGTTGLDYAKNRYYSSILGRFLSPDPYRATAKGANNPADPGSWNRYAYVENDPVNFHDPKGLFLSADELDEEDEPPPKRRDPNCDPNNAATATVFSFIDTNRAGAQDLSAQLGLRADFILAWAAVESGWGNGGAARLNDNFFGLTTTKKNPTGNWIGAIPCSLAPGATKSGFACFPSSFADDFYDNNNLYVSGLSALTSQNDRYLNAALKAQKNGGDISAIANAVAKAGFNSEPIDYGARVAGAAEAIAKREDCPQ